MVRLLLVMPATNTTSERSFSALCQIKTYLRSTMTQMRMNNLMILHIHRELTDSLNIIGIANVFTSEHDHQQQIFGKFKSDDVVVFSK